MSIEWNPRAVVEIGGERLDSFKDVSLLSGVEVELATGEASQAALHIFDPDFKYLDKWTRADGVDLLPAKCWLGFGDALGGPVFSGLLARVERDQTTSSFRFFDLGLKMRQAKRTEYHKGLTDIGIFEILARRNGLEFEGPRPAIKLDKHKSIIQDALSDWEFAQERADEIGVVLYVREGVLYAKEAAKTGEPLASLIYKKDVALLPGFHFEFRTPENREGRPGKVETRVRGKGGRRLRGRATEGKRGTSHIEIKRDLATRSKRAADRRAEARKALQREHAFTLSVVILPTFRGRRPDIRDTVEILNVGKLFSNRYLCDRVMHSFRGGELRTTLDLYRDIREG